MYGKCSGCVLIGLNREYKCVSTYIHTLLIGACRSYEEKVWVVLSMLRRIVLSWYGIQSFIHGQGRRQDWKEHSQDSSRQRGLEATSKRFTASTSMLKLEFS